MIIIFVFSFVFLFLFLWLEIALCELWAHRSFGGDHRAVSRHTQRRHTDSDCNPIEPIDSVIAGLWRAHVRCAMVYMPITQPTGHPLNNLRGQKRTTKSHTQQ